jgi:H+/Cl- antiporter ClcA
MKRKVVEQSILIISIIKWIMLASCVGTIVGAATSIFLKLLGKGTSLMSGIPYYYLLAGAIFGVTYFHEPLNLVPAFSSAFFRKVCLGGIFFGICSLILIEILKIFDKVNRKIHIREEWKALLSGCFLTLLTFIFSTSYLGLGLETIKNALEGQHIPWYASFLAIIFTSITLGFGGSGGIITPIFFVGSTAGNGGYRQCRI